MRIPERPEAEVKHNARGAYGLTFPELRGALVPDPPDGWPVVEVRRGAPDPSPARESVDDETATIPLIDGGYVRCERTPPSATYRTRPLDDDELVHPYLAPVGMMFAYWLGRESFHCGAVVGPRGAVGVVGDKEAGKSTLLAWLAANGHGVLTDDLLVVGGGSALAGPRCIDLRPASADHLEATGRLVRAGERSRVLLPDVEPSVHLLGWVYLSWGDDLALEPIAPARRIAQLARHRAVRLEPTDPVALLDVGRLPAYDLRRPKDWSSLEPSAGLLLDLVSG